MRIKERREHWRALVEKHAKSGLTAVVFCKERRIKPHELNVL